MGQLAQDVSGRIYIKWDFTTSGVDLPQYRNLELNDVGVILSGQQASADWAGSSGYCSVFQVVILSGQNF